MGQRGGGHTNLAVGGEVPAGIQEVAAQLRREHAQDAALEDARQRRVQHEPAGEPPPPQHLYMRPRGYQELANVCTSPTQCAIRGNPAS